MLSLVVEFNFTQKRVTFATPRQDVRTCLREAALAYICFIVGLVFALGI